MRGWGVGQEDWSVKDVAERERGEDACRMWAFWGAEKCSSATGFLAFNAQLGLP